jgi:arylsulfatase A-like enzyme
MTLWEEGYATRLLADDAVRLIRDRDRERPLFLYVAFGAPHLPNEAPAEGVDRQTGIEDARRRLHAAMVSELDTGVGRIVGTLRDEGMIENTVVLFASDNGGLSPGSAPEPVLALAGLLTRFFDRPLPFEALEFLVANAQDGASDNAPLSGGKTRVGEGGVRVPASIAWPRRLPPGRHDGFMTIADVLPTLLEAVAGAGAVPEGLDGASQWASLTGAGQSAQPDHLVVGLDGEALYRPPWKLVLCDPPRLYDVYADPLEAHDRAADEPLLVEQLRAAAAAWPRGHRNAMSLFDIFRDPDRFGGPEDRAPWAEAARRRASESH